MRSPSIVESGGMAQAENRDWLNVDMKSLYSNPSSTPGRDRKYFIEKNEPERLHTWGTPGIVGSGVRHGAGNREIK